MKLLQQTCWDKKMTVIVITHNSAITPMADHVIEIKNGRVGREYHNVQPLSVDTIEW